MDAEEIGRRLARRHGAFEVEVDPVRSLLNYAEAPRVGDWTLRSALVRLAQPEPVRVGDLLQVMRRLDAPLGHVARDLQRHGTNCDLALLGDDVDLGSLLVDPADQTYPDIRTADLARAAAQGWAEAELLAGYRSVTSLERQEELALPLLVVAARLERLAGRLTSWADREAGDPPLTAVDQVTAEAIDRLDELDVPVETGPPPRGARSSRG